MSCQKYLEIKQNSSQTLISTPNDCQQLLNDYNSMNAGYPSDGEASADNYYLNDAGFLSASVTSEDRNIHTWYNGAVRSVAFPQWQYSYKVVYLSNLILEALEQMNQENDQLILNDLRGQALFFRAYSFWQIAQLYAKPYVSATANSDLGIPLRLKSDINDKSTRGTVEGTYKKIIDDLITASNLLNTTSVVPSRPNKISAYAMLSRVYLSMEVYSEALKYSTLALELNNQLLDFNTLNITSNTPFSRFNKEVIFQSIMTSSILLNPGSATSNIAKIDIQLVNSYNDNDLRKALFFKSNSGSNLNTFRFTGNYDPVTSAALFNGIATDELYITRAECYARSGNLTNALGDLNTLLKSRWKSGTYTDFSTNNLDVALSKILNERRKELLMRGLRWSDLRRLNRDNRFSLTLLRKVNGADFDLPPNDLRYTLLIPSEVINNSEVLQNPR